MKQVNFTIKKETWANPARIYQCLSEAPLLERWWKKPVSGSGLQGDRIVFHSSNGGDGLAVRVQGSDVSSVKWLVTSDMLYQGKLFDCLIEFELKPFSQSGCELTLIVSNVKNGTTTDQLRQEWEKIITAIAKEAEE